MIDHWNDAQRIESEEKSRRAVGDTGVNWTMNGQTWFFRSYIYS